MAINYEKYCIKCGNKFVATNENETLCVNCKSKIVKTSKNTVTKCREEAVVSKPEKIGSSNKFLKSTLMMLKIFIFFSIITVAVMIVLFIVIFIRGLC